MRPARGSSGLDADDRLDADNRQKLQTLLANLKPEMVAYSMKCLCLSAAERDGDTMVDHVRLFPNHPEVRWRFRVHEQILPALRDHGAGIRWADVTIQHVGYCDAELRRRKLERDLRLLYMEEQDNPGHPFTLFNLGSVHQELGRHEEALPYLQRSLESSHPSDSIVRKLYTLIAHSQRQLVRHPAALATCLAGRRYYPDDVELLFLEGVQRQELGDEAGAEECYQRLLASREAEHFGSVATGVRGHKTRSNLALLYLRQGRLVEAEAQWRAALAEKPDFLPAWMGLGDLFLAAGRWTDVDQTTARLDGLPDGKESATVLRSRAARARAS